MAVLAAPVRRKCPHRPKGGGRCGQSGTGHTFAKNTYAIAATATTAHTHTSLFGMPARRVYAMQAIATSA